MQISNFNGNKSKIPKINPKISKMVVIYHPTISFKVQLEIQCLLFPLMIKYYYCGEEQIFLQPSDPIMYEQMSFEEEDIHKLSIFPLELFMPHIRIIVLRSYNVRIVHSTYYLVAM